MKKKILIPSPLAHKFGSPNGVRGIQLAPVNLADINHSDDDDNTAGLQQTILYAQLSDILTLPTPVVDDTSGSGSFSDLVTISSNIVMKAQKAFSKIYATLESSNLDGKLQGDLDGKSFMNAISFLHPGSKADILGFSQWAKNKDLIFIVAEADGRPRILGHAGYPAKMASGEHTTGTKSGDRKGNTFTFQSARKGPCPYFTGKILLTGSSVGSGTFDANSNSYQDVTFISGS